MARCPVLKKAPDSCVDFSTQGNLVTDKYRKGWDKIFGSKTPEFDKEYGKRLNEAFEREKCG